MSLHTVSEPTSLQSHLQYIREETTEEKKIYKENIIMYIVAEGRTSFQHNHYHLRIFSKRRTN